ncbi:ceramide glucosyltransferase, partial [Xylariales sp. AK1849]
MIPVVQAIGYAWFGWGCFILIVQCIGSYKIFKAYSSIPKKPVSSTLPKDEVPHVTVVRPAKGLEPSLYECLASTFHQAYPKERLTIYFCVASRDDPAYPIMRKVIDDFPGFDAKLFVEEEDPVLHGNGGHMENLGPNPKIRNESRAYREAKGDIVWVIDCNVWIAKDVAGHMIDRLCGFASDGKQHMPHKLVHQLPLVVDTVSSLRRDSFETQALLSGSSDASVGHHVNRSLISQGGGRLEEMFMSTSHAKFYGAINAVGVAPCIVGKSNMFRKSHLDMVTNPARNPILASSAAQLPTGLDHFSTYICEDHLIGDLLWRSSIPGFKNHGLVWGNLAIQPMAGMSVAAYVARRVRWLRVRKFTVLLATLVEPGTESLLCCFYLSFGLTSIPWFHGNLGLTQTWVALGQLWLASVMIWMIVDRIVSNRLHAGYSVDIDENTPSFAKGSKRGGAERRPFGQWLLAWIGREFLALPIWTWAVLLGTTVTWRGEKFRVRPDMKVVAIDDGRRNTSSAGTNGQASNKI